MILRSASMSLGILVLGAVLGVGSGQPYEEVIDQSFAVSTSAQVSLDNVNGDVSIEVWDRDEVRVHAIKRASTPELLAELEVRIDASANGVDVGTHYPSGNLRGESTSVDYTLTVPRQARIESVDLVNGNLRIVGVEGGVEAESVNGSIHAEGLAGEVGIETVNGALELEASSSGLGDHVSLESVNGSLEIFLPAAADVAVHAETVNGSIRTDLGIEVRKGRYIGSSMHGTLGSGAGRLSIETVNGPISVRAR